MPQVVDCHDGPGGAICPIGPVLGCQVDRYQGAMPVIGNEDAVIPIHRAIAGDHQWRLQARQVQQGKAVLQQESDLLRCCLHRLWLLDASGLAGRQRQGD